MAKKVLKYLLEGVGTVPAAIADGGYWPIGAELVGVSVDDSQRYVSSSYVSMTRADLTARLASMTLHDRDGNVLTDQNKADALTAWLAMVGMSDLA